MSANAHCYCCRARTDGSISDRGFNLSYSVSPCGGVVSGPAASLTSAGYPGPYPASTTCVWLLSFAPGSQVEITTAAFALEPDCAADNVTIRNGGQPDRWPIISSTTTKYF